MQDRPSKTELLRGVQYFLEDEAIPGLSGEAKFHARVALHTVRMVMRELDAEENDLKRELAGLRRLVGPESLTAVEGLDEVRTRVRRMNEDLAEKIRRGDLDSSRLREETLVHLRESIYRKLKVVNPEQAKSARAELAIAPDEYDDGIEAE